MAAASRVQVVPPASRSEEELLAAARELAPTGKPVRPGDLVGGLVVLVVDPAPGATLAEATEIEILPTPRRRDAPMVEIAILLDVSESMGIPWDATHTRLDAARVAISSLLEKPTPAVADVTLYHYAKETTIVSGPAAPHDTKLAPAPRPAGRSDTARALHAVLADLAARTRPDRSQVVMLFTDGVGDVTDLMEAARRAGHLHVPIHCLVFAPEVDDVFEELTRASGGSVQQAAYPLTIEFVHMPGG